MFDDLLGSPRQYMIIFFIVLNHPKKCCGYHGLGWLRRQFFRPSSLWDHHVLNWPLSVPHQVIEKTTKPSKNKISFGICKKKHDTRIYKACSTTVCQVCVRFVTLLIGNKAEVFSQCVRVKWLGDEGISPRPEHRDDMGGRNMGGPQVTMVVSLLNGLIDLDLRYFQLLAAAFEHFFPAFRPGSSTPFQPEQCGRLVWKKGPLEHWCPIQKFWLSRWDLVLGLRGLQQTFC